LRRLRFEVVLAIKVERLDGVAGAYIAAIEDAFRVSHSMTSSTIGEQASVAR
jgi:hypothetical protein